MNFQEEHQESSAGEYERVRLNVGNPRKPGAKGRQDGTEKNRGDCMAVGAVSREPFSTEFPV